MRFACWLRVSPHKLWGFHLVGIALAALLLAPSPSWGQGEGPTLAVILPRANPGDLVSGSLVLDTKLYSDVPGLQVTDTHIPNDVSKDRKSLLVDVGNGYQSGSEPFTLVLPTDRSTVKISIRAGGVSHTTEVPVPVPLALPQVDKGRTPPLCATGGLNVIHASVKGSARATNIEVEGKRADIVAERPGAVYWLVPRANAGEVEVRLTEGDSHHRFFVYLAEATLEMEGDQTSSKRKLVQSSLLSPSVPFSVSVRIPGMTGYQRWPLGPPSDLVDVDSITKRYSPARVPGVEPLLQIRNLSPEKVELQAYGNANAESDVAEQWLDLTNRSYTYKGLLRRKGNADVRVAEVKIALGIIPFFAEKEELSENARSEPESLPPRQPPTTASQAPSTALAERPAMEPFYLSWEETGETIARWRQQTGITVTPDASRQVQEQFWSETQRLSNAIEKQKLDAEGRSLLYDWLVESYLYEVRDRTGSGRREAYKPGLLQGSNAFISGPQSEARPLINTLALSRFTVAKYLAGLLPLFQGPVGRLLVTSAPEGASIVIDGKDRGKSCKKFVSSVGSHSITVSGPDGKMECKDNVMIEPSKFKHYSCPKSSDCPTATN